MLYKGDPRDLSCPFCHVITQWKDTIFRPGRELSSNTKFPITLILDLASRIMRNTCSIFKPTYSFLNSQGQVNLIENSMVATQNIKHRITIWNNSSTSRYIHKMLKAGSWQTNLYTHAYNSIIHNRQKKKATQNLSIWLINR